MSLNGRERPTYPAGRTQARPQVYQYYQPRSYQGGRGRGNWQARGNPSSARGRTSQRSGRPPWQQSPRPPGSWQQSRQTQSDGFYTDQDETDQVDANANQHQTDQTDETFHTESMEPSYDEEAELITAWNDHFFFNNDDEHQEIEEANEEDAFWEEGEYGWQRYDGDY